MAKSIFRSKELESIGLRSEIWRYTSPRSIPFKLSTALDTIHILSVARIDLQILSTRSGSLSNLIRTLVADLTVPLPHVELFTRPSLRRTAHPSLHQHQVVSTSTLNNTMPVLELRTNTKIANKKEVTLKASKLISQLLGKSEAVLPLPGPLRPSLPSLYFSANPLPHNPCSHCPRLDILGHELRLQ